MKKNTLTVNLIRSVIISIGTMFFISFSNAHEPTYINCRDKRDDSWWLNVMVHIAEPSDKYSDTIAWLKDSAAKACSYFPEDKKCGWKMGKNIKYSVSLYKADSDEGMGFDELFIDRIKGEATLYTNGREVVYTCNVLAPKF
jgi:hypothetical protein